MSITLLDWLVLDEWALAVLIAAGIVLGLLVRAAFGRTAGAEYVRTTWAKSHAQCDRKEEPTDV